VKGELAAVLVPDIEPGDVGRHQVRCELDAVEGAADAFGQAFGHEGLGHAGHILQENMPLGDQGYEQ